MIQNFLITAWRSLIKNKVYTFLNVLGVTIGVVVCLLIGVWLQRELSYDDFHPNAEKIFRIANTFKSESETFSQAPAGIALGARLPNLLSSVKAACRVFQFEYKFRVGNNQFFESRTLVVDSNFFRFFGFHLLEGQPAKVLNSTYQVVLSEKMAIKYFGTSQGIVGKTMLMDDHPMTVAGVATDPPVNSHLQYDFVIPYTYFRNYAISHWKEDLDDEWVGGWPYTYVQLTDGSKWKEAEKQINAVVEKFSLKDWKESKMSYHYFLQPIRAIHLKSNLRYDAANNGSLSTVTIFSVIGLIVLLLACINYVNLTTAGAVKRAKETSVRKVVGASRLQLFAQFYLESLLICTFSVLLGVLLAKAILPAFSSCIGHPYYIPLGGINVLILAIFTLGLSLVAGVYPATILSSQNPAICLKGNFLQSIRGIFFRKSLVVFQFTISIALAASILIIGQQMNFIKNKSLGYSDNAIVEINFNGDEIAARHYDIIRSELLQNPYVLNVCSHDANIVGGLGNGWTTTQNSKGEEISTSIYRLNVDANYFDTYDMKLAAGRFFSINHPADSASSVLVNEQAVKTFGWHSPAEAIGKLFGTGDKKRYVIGVLKDFHFESLHKPVDPLLVGYTRAANSMSIKLNHDHIQETMNFLEKIWKNNVPEVPLKYSFIDERIAEQYGSEQKMEAIFYGFSSLSLLIACLGLFGLSIYVVERKVKETAVRKILGASVTGIVYILSKDFLMLVLLSFAIALPLGWLFMSKWLQEFAYHINISWWEFALAGGVALIIALSTVSFQAIKAAITKPVKSLRSE
jgi:putative ABC transport system permease protein